MTVKNIEISVQGKWCKVPAVETNGKDIIVKGKWLRLAVVNAEEWLETELENPDSCVRALKQQTKRALRADILTFTQKPPSTEPKYEYLTEPDSVAVARTSSFKEWWENLPQETRKNVRRSQKRGVVISVRGLDDELIKGIMSVNNDYPVRQGRPYAHYGKTFEQVKKDQSSYLDRSEFICAHVGDELIGFIKIVYRGEVASILNLLPKASHQDKKPANALIAKAVELCEARGVSYLTYGLLNYNKRETQLREFKARNGFEEMLLPRYYVPLTLRGRICMQLGLHRGIREIVPQRLITFAADARAKWYNLRQSISRRSSIAEQSNRNRQMECANPPAGSNN